VVDDIALYPEDDEEFEAVCRSIAKAWRSEQEGGEATARLEARVYRLVEHLIARDLLDELMCPRESRLDRRGAPGYPNAFRRALRVIFAGEFEPIGTQTRSDMAIRLEYAYRHFVPPEFLKVFLTSLGVRPKVTSIHPGYESWVALNLRKAWNKHLIPEYPKSIRKLARRKKDRAWRKPGP